MHVWREEDVLGAGILRFEGGPGGRDVESIVFWSQEGELSATE